jgi:hypothetical protein
MGVWYSAQATIGPENVQMMAPRKAEIFRTPRERRKK